MFKPLPMQYITLQMVVDDAPTAALVLAEYGVFDPERTPEEVLPEFPAEHYRNLVNSAQARLDKILSHYGMPVTVPAAPSHLVYEEELARLDSWLGELWAQCSEWSEELRRLTEEQKQVDQLMMMLVNFLDLDIDLSRLQRETYFLDVHIGIVPLANVQRLQEALGLAGYVLSRFLESDGSTYVLVAGPRGGEEDIADVLREAGWHPLRLPPEFRDYPDKVRREFLKRRRQLVKDQQAVQEKIAQSERRHRNRLIAAAQTLALATPYARLGEVLRGRGGLAVLNGWVPKREVARLEKILRERLHHPLVLTAREPLPGESVPSCMHHHRWLRPFVALVKNYGVPRYGEFDPTLLFAFTYIAMFGMMYGDVGHGAVIAAGGLLLRRRLRGFAPFVAAIGMASLGFGFLYGSIFGFEEVIQPLWIAPLSDPVLMLKIALYWGIGFILLATTLTVYNRISEGHIVEALCDGKGLAGMLFYLGLLYGGYRWLVEARFGALQILAILLPLGTVLAYRWQESRIPLGERLLVVFIEGFEAIMAYLSGTLSFLRVAAFSLNHVALAIAVLTLAQMMDKTGHWLTIVLGNLFSLGLEGAIVAIQVLRLEYYEGFSRFFRGDGREFRPLTLFTNSDAKATLQTF